MALLDSKKFQLLLQNLLLIKFDIYSISPLIKCSLLITTRSFFFYNAALYVAVIYESKKAFFLPKCRY